MLRVKSVVMLKANPGILKCGGVIKMWMWPCVETESYLGFGDRVGMRKIGRNIVRQKKMLREKYIWLWIKKIKRQWGWLIHSCHDGRELFRFAKLKIGQKKYIIGVSCLKDEGGAVKVSVGDQQKSWKEQQKS